MSEPRIPRTEGGSLLRQALDEVEAQVKRRAVEDPQRTQVTAFLAYDKETGAEIGGAVLFHGPKGSEWTLTGALRRKVTASPSPYAVRLELHGRI